METNSGLISGSKREKVSEHFATSRKSSSWWHSEWEQDCDCSLQGQLNKGWAFRVLPTWRSFQLSKMPEKSYFWCSGSSLMKLSDVSESIRHRWTLRRCNGHFIWCVQNAISSSLCFGNWELEASRDYQHFRLQPVESSYGRILVFFFVSYFVYLC